MKKCIGLLSGTCFMYIRGAKQTAGTVQFPGNTRVAQGYKALLYKHAKALQFQFEKLPDAMRQGVCEIK